MINKHRQKKARQILLQPATIDFIAIQLGNYLLAAFLLFHSWKNNRQLAWDWSSFFPLFLFLFMLFYFGQVLICFAGILTLLRKLILLYVFPHRIITDQ